MGRFVISVVALVVARHLKAKRTDIVIDGVDISADMLAVAAEKSLYQIFMKLI